VHVSISNKAQRRGGRIDDNGPYLAKPVLGVCGSKDQQGGKKGTLAINKLVGGVGWVTTSIIGRGRTKIKNDVLAIGNASEEGQSQTTVDHEGTKGDSERRLWSNAIKVGGH